MLRWSLKDLRDPVGNIDLITTDVFDTLLLRIGRSERSRLVAGEMRFAKLLAEEGFIVRRDDLVESRLLAQKFAYRALNCGGHPGEVRLVDIIQRQLLLLGLPVEMAEQRIGIEVIEEKLALAANKELAGRLRIQRGTGMRIVAVSDTGLPGEKVMELINHFHGPGLIDSVFSSADARVSKRQGDLFDVVLKSERVAPDRTLHIGDDQHADCHIPELKGIHTIRLTTNPLKRYASLANGAATETARKIRKKVARRPVDLTIPTDRPSFGDSVFGPIVAQFCLYIWLYSQQANVREDSVLLFCARGGIGIREAFERVVNKLGLPLSIRRENLLISRLVAARAAVAVRSAVALDELSREFHGAPFSDVACALGGKSYELDATWQAKFDPIQFYALLDTHAGEAISSDIRLQNELFKRHLDTVSQGSSRVILCDTGLYGSTQRLMAAGFPERQFETVQFARCNYKGLSEDHFPKVSGLVVEQNLYNPLRVESVVLRYWQIIESLFEPKIASVARFDEEDGQVRANSGNIQYGSFCPEAGNLLLDGTLQYIDRLTSGEQILNDADGAWRLLRKAILFPNERDISILSVGARSVDFGRSDFIQVINTRRAADLAERLKAVKSNLWREGAISRDFELLRSPLLACLELTHITRAILSWRH